MKIFPLLLLNLQLNSWIYPHLKSAKLRQSEDFFCIERVVNWPIKNNDTAFVISVALNIGNLGGERDPKPYHIVTVSHIHIHIHMYILLSL